MDPEDSDSLQERPTWLSGREGHSNNDACWLSDSIDITQALLVLIGHYYDACLRSTLLRSIPNKLCKFLSDEYSLVYISLSPRPGYYDTVCALHTTLSIVRVPFFWPM